MEASQDVKEMSFRIRRGLTRRGCALYSSGLYGSTEEVLTQSRRVTLPSAKRYWLMKSEPSVFSIQDLKKSPHQATYSTTAMPIRRLW